MSKVKKITISINPNQPKDLKLTAQGYKKMISTSNKTNKIAVIKYLTEKGLRALPTLSSPHSKVSSCLFPLAFGPKKCVASKVTTTNPAATKNCRSIGR